MPSKTKTKPAAKPAKKSAPEKKPVKSTTGATSPRSPVRAKPAKSGASATTAAPKQSPAAKTGRFDASKPNKSNVPKSPAPSAMPSGNGAQNGGKRQRNELSEKGIRRLDTKPDAAKQTHGYQVCATINGAPHTKLFSDSAYGSAGDALDAARLYRDSLAAV